MGASAWTHVATSNIEHVKYFDCNDFDLKCFKGLNFYNGIIICHYDENRNKIYQELKNTKKCMVDTLTDDEILFYSNNIWKKF